MSNPLRYRASRLAAAVLGALLGLAPLPGEGALAQEDLVESFRQRLVESVSPRWTGPRVPWPDAAPRPGSAGLLRSITQPVNVHVEASIGPERAEAALRGLERAHGWLASRGWPLPYPDGGLGGTAGFDLYVEPSLEPSAELGIRPEDGTPPRPGGARVDRQVLYESLDAATTHARMDATVERSRIEACAISLYVEAALLGQDPAEAASWRIATGDFVAWLVTGEFGCQDGVVHAQQDPTGPWIGHDPASGEGGALFLALLSARTDDHRGSFIRDLWSGARQRTWEGEGLRASPDLWEVLRAVMAVGDDPLDRFLEEASVARFYAGEGRARGAVPIPMLRELPPEASVPTHGRTRFERLPRRVEPHGLELGTQGSAYVVVDVRAAPPGSTLRIWLRGEYGVSWSLIAVRIGEDGTERGRVRAPPRPRTPRSYIPLELPDDETETVLIAVTNLGAGGLDADVPDVFVRSFRLILDKVEPAGVAPGSGPPRGR